MTRRVPIPFGSRTMIVVGEPVRMRLIRQFGQWYAVGGGYAGMGNTRDAAYDDLAGLLAAVRSEAG